MRYKSILKYKERYAVHLSFFFRHTIHYPKNNIYLFVTWNIILWSDQLYYDSCLWALWFWLLWLRVLWLWLFWLLCLWLLWDENSMRRLLRNSGDIGSVNGRFFTDGRGTYFRIGCALKTVCCRIFKISCSCLRFCSSNICINMTWKSYPYDRTRLEIVVN